MLRARGQEWKTTTNAVGHYEFRVPAGKYAIHVDVPATEHAYGRRETELLDPRGCAREDFYVVADGRIATRIVDSEGKPLPGVVVEFVKHETMSDARPSVATWATSDADGRVEARELQSDDYVIGVNVNRPPESKQPYERVFYPGVADPTSARVVELQPGERVELDAFVLPPPLSERRISGVVRWPDGSPAAKASVALRRARGTPQAGMHVGTLVTTDAEGRFTIAAPGAQRYRALAFVDVKSQTGSVVQWSAESAAFDADAGGPMTLVLAPPRR
jgi:5-hydroxyisourate hydrolase-like protein (transthyretin family)